jgi:hypothetical protein
MWTVTTVALTVFLTLVPGPAPLLRSPYAVSAAPITVPFGKNGDISKVIPDYFDTKKQTKTYHNSTPDQSVAGDIQLVRQYNVDPRCKFNKIEMKLRWSTPVGSSVFGHPMIFPAGPNGKKQIFLSTFFNYVELIGYDGYKPWGWPLSFEGSSFQGSPMLYDIDGDGTNDIGFVDKDGNMFWVRVGEFGQYLEDYHIQVPKLKIVRGWYESLDPKFTDRYVETSIFEHEHRFAQHYGEEEKKPEVKQKPSAKSDALKVVSSSKDRPALIPKVADEFGSRKGKNLFVGSGGRRLTEETTEEGVPQRGYPGGGDANEIEKHGGEGEAEKDGLPMEGFPGGLNLNEGQPVPVEEVHQDQQEEVDSRQEGAAEKGILHQGYPGGGDVNEIENSGQGEGKPEKDGVPMRGFPGNVDSHEGQPLQQGEDHRAEQHHDAFDVIKNEENIGIQDQLGENIEAAEIIPDPYANTRIGDDYQPPQGAT